MPPASRQAAAQRVSDQRRLVRAREPEQAGKPVGEARRVQPVERVGLAQAGHVRDDDAVALGKTGHHGRPVDPAALDSAVQQHERGPVAAFQHGGGHSRRLDPSLRDRDARPAVAAEGPRAGCAAYGSVQDAREPASHAAPGTRRATSGSSASPSAGPAPGTSGTGRERSGTRNAIGSSTAAAAPSSSAFMSSSLSATPWFIGQNDDARRVGGDASVPHGDERLERVDARREARSCARSRGPSCRAPRTRRGRPPRAPRTSTPSRGPARGLAADHGERLLHVEAERRVERERAHVEGVLDAGGSRALLRRARAPPPSACAPRPRSGPRGRR